MIHLRLILIVFSLVCFCLAVSNLVSDRVRVIAAGLAFYAASQIF